MVVDENYLIADLENIQKQREFEERQSEIFAEYNLYKCFCKLFGMKCCEYSSLVNFQNYCKENFIQLI